ncbi:MAG: FG-GAP repeat domain-containing protein [Myxococcota bacterium]
MRLGTIATRASLLLTAIAACIGIGQAAEAELVVLRGVTEATLAWPPPNEPSIYGYMVFASRNGGDEYPAGFVTDPSFRIDGEIGDRVVIRVRAIGNPSPSDPLVASDFSPSSPTIVFSNAPEIPADELLFLHCSPCSRTQFRPLSNAWPAAEVPALPEPWHLVEIASFAGPLDEIWQHEDTGAIVVLSFGQGSEGIVAASNSPSLAGSRALAVAEIDGVAPPELLVRDASGSRLETWGLDGGALVHRGGIEVDPDWSFAGLADVDADGGPDIWWQTDEPGHIEAWKPAFGGVPTVLLSIATGADGDVVALSDFNDDGHADPVWQNAGGDLTITYLRAGRRQNLGELRRSVTLPGLPGDDRLAVRGVGDPLDMVGRAILVQDLETRSVSAIFPSYEEFAARIPLFDLSERFDLVQVR